MMIRAKRTLSICHHIEIHASGATERLRRLRNTLEFRRAPADAVAKGWRATASVQILEKGLRVLTQDARRVEGANILNGSGTRRAAPSSPPSFRRLGLQKRPHKVDRTVKEVRRLCSELTAGVHDW